MRKPLKLPQVPLRSSILNQSPYYSETVTGPELQNNNFKRRLPLGHFIKLALTCRIWLEDNIY